jgi:hypothetical protein
MMTKVNLTLTRRDFRRARRNSPRACLVARGLERQEGGKWRVGVGEARRRDRWLSPKWKAGKDAQELIEKFDGGASARDIFGGRKSVQVTLNAPAQRRQRSQRRRIKGRTKVMTVTAASAVVLLGEGRGWVVFTAIGVFLAALIGLFTVRRISRPSTVRRISRPSTVRVPQPARVPQQARVPEPDPWPQPRPVRVPELDRVPEPERVPDPWPQPRPVRVPELDRVPEPHPRPVRVPEPQSWPVRAPQPAPRPHQVPEPERAPAPWPDPEPAAQGAVPERAPDSWPQSEPAGIPERGRG